MNSMRILFIFCSCLLLACNEQQRGGHTAIAPAFYHWKTVFNPTGFEKELMYQNNVRHLYLRFFDVAWDATTQQPEPIAQLRIAKSTSLAGYQIIPTVFITNECIRYIKPEQCKPLAEKIYGLIIAIAANHAMDTIHEIQLDCDWTASTRQKYFTLLTELQKIDTARLFSATIRLFQVKYAAEAGIPPVKKGLLMCYNMGNLKSMQTANSILQTDELKKYTSNLQQYALPLDVALPLFQWFVLFRQGAYTGLIQNISLHQLMAIAHRQSANIFEAKMDTMMNGVALKKGDIIRREDCAYETILEAASILQSKLPRQPRRLVLYHLDSITLSKYSAHEMETIFNSLH